MLEKVGAAGLPLVCFGLNQLANTINTAVISRQEQIQLECGSVNSAQEHAWENAFHGVCTRTRYTYTIHVSGIIGRKLPGLNFFLWLSSAVDTLTLLVQRQKNPHWQSETLHSSDW